MSESKSEKRIAFITTPEVVRTKNCLFSFMMEAGTDFYRKEILPIPGKKVWGFIALRKKGDDEFAPFVWAENQRQGLCLGDDGYQQCIGDDGILRLDAHLFESGEILSSGIDFDPGHELERIQRTMEEFPSCTVLIPRCLYDLAAKAAKNLGFKVAVYHHDEPIQTG